MSPAADVKFGNPYTTAEQASALGCPAAREWQPTAVLYYISPDSSFMDHDFMETGLATRWGMEFANRADNTMLFVHVVAGKVDYTKNLGNTRDAPVNSKLTDDVPVLALLSAAQTALERGAPRGVQLSDASYRAEPDSGSAPQDPRWSFSFSFITDTEKNLKEYHFYVIDALTNTINEAKTGFIQQPGSKLLTVDQLTVKPGYEKPEDEESIIRKFYSLISKRELDEAFKLIGAASLKDKNARKMWEDMLEKVVSLDVAEVTVKSTGADGSRVCEVRLFATGEKDMLQQQMWEPYPTSNYRYLTLKPSGSTFLITDLATSP